MTETSPARRSGRDDLVRYEASQNYEAAKSGGSLMVALAWISAILWFVALGAAFYGLDGFTFVETQPPALIAAIAMAALIPALLIISAGYMARTSRRTSAANALVLEAAARLMAPAREAGVEGITFAEQMKQSATEVDRAMARALAAMKAMAAELGDERLRLESVSCIAADNARDLAARLMQERHALESLASELRAQVSAISDTIPRQAQLMVSEARKASVQVGRADAALDERIDAMPRAAALAARLESEAPGRLAGPMVPAGSPAAVAPLTPPPQPAPSSGPEPQPYQSGVSRLRSVPQPAATAHMSAPPPRAAPHRSGVDDDLFEASADAFIARAGLDADQHPAGRGEPPMVPVRPIPPEPDGERPPRQPDRSASAPFQPAAPRRRETDYANGHSSANGSGGPAPWREIISDISREPGAGLPPADRESVASAVVERLQGSGIPLGDVFKPRAKRKIAEAHRKGDRERRAAAAEQAGRQVERVVHRLKGDARLMEMARQFLDFEREDALAALQQTQSTSRNASPRLATFLLLDAVIA